MSYLVEEGFPGTSAGNEFDSCDGLIGQVGRLFPVVTLLQKSVPWEQCQASAPHP